MKLVHIFKKNLKRVFLVISNLIIAFLIWTPVVAEELATIKLGVNSYRVEIASTSAERQSGLMHRQTLAPGTGMLFFYPRSAQHRIWMKNTLIPLQVIWIDANFEVIDSKILKPCETIYCPSFGVDRPSKYILEINSNETYVKAGTMAEGIPEL